MFLQLGSILLFHQPRCCFALRFFTCYIEKPRGVLSLPAGHPPAWDEAPNASTPPEHLQPCRESESENAPRALHASCSSRAAASPAPSRKQLARVGGKCAEHKGHRRRSPATCRHGKCPIHSRGPPGAWGREAGAL